MTGPVTDDLLSPGWRAVLDEARARPAAGHDRPGTVLVDEAAEAATAGCAVGSLPGAVWAAEWVDPAWFHDARYRLCFDAAVRCELADLDDRVHDVAIDAGQRHDWVARLAQDRPVQADLGRIWIRRVAAAFQARRRAEGLLGQLEDLGIGVTAVGLPR